MEISLRNQLKGRITEIVRGDVVSEVVVDTAAGHISAVITTRSIDRLVVTDLQGVHALVKATEVGIEKP